MSWFRGDDRLHAHRKTRAVLRSHPGKSRDAAPMGLWILAGTWAAQNATVGWAPSEELDRFDDQWEDLAARLVSAGFWWPETRGGEPGFGFVNWEEYNPSPGQSSEDGRYGNHVRWHVKRGIASPDCDLCPRDPGPDSPPDSTPDNPEPSGAIAPRLATRSPNESPSIAQPNPIPTHTQPIPIPLAIGDENDGHTAAHVPARTPATADVPKTPKGTRLPDGWIPARTEANLAAESTHDGPWLSRELERFRDYWAAAAGAKGVKANWDSTWRNWIKTAEDRSPRNNGRPVTAAALTEADWSRWMANAKAADEANERSAS